MSSIRRMYYRFLDHFESKSWLEGGFRTFVPRTYHRFLLKTDHDSYQGDHRYSITLHLFGRAFQVTYWQR